MATTYYNDIQKLYVAYFNRPADPAGLAYWETVVEAQKGSTAAVSASFAASAEYKAAYAGMANADIVNAVYMNLFGHAADTAGQAYWAALLDGKKITIDNAVTQIAGGAQGTDMVAYNNKVTAAGTFTANIDTDAEKAGYSGDAANKVAKAFLSGITDNVSLTTATTPAALNASIAATVAAGTPFTVAGALAQVSAAQAITDAFVKATVTSDVNGDGVKNAADITAAQTKAVAKVAGDLSGGAAGPSGSLFGASTTAQVVRDALVNSQQAVNAQTLATAQANLAADNAAIAKVAGLTDAVALLAASQSALKSGVAAEVTTHADIVAKEAAFGINNGGAAVYGSTSVTFTPAGGTTATLVDIDANGKATLHSGVDATKYVGLTDLIASLNAETTATANIASATANVNNAQLVVNMLDIAPATAGTVGSTGLTESALVAAIAAQINTTTAGTVAAGATPTLAQIQTELAVLKATDTAHYTTFNALVTAESASVGDAATAAANLASATAALTAANTALTNANSALTAAQTASTSANSTLTTAETAFEGGSNVTVSGSTLVFTPSGGSVTTLADIDATGHASLHAGVTETTNVGVTALITKYNASVDAAALVATDTTAVATATTAVGSATTALNTATTANAAVALNPLTAVQSSDAATVAAANAAISTLAKDVAALATANANAATLAGDQASVTAYNKVLTDKGYVVTTLDTAHSGAFTQFGTAASDVFIVSGNNATIGAFGLQGSDSLFVGSGYSLVQGKIGATGVTGNNAALEIFASNDGAGNATLQIETHAYSSSVASTAGEVVTITLTGVDATTLQLNNGIITSGAPHA